MAAYLYPRPLHAGRTGRRRGDLLQARMCIRANDTELLPEWARFVRGAGLSRPATNRRRSRQRHA
ncbi:MAG: hypothetical protein R3F36_05525 [Candidatus Competibacteraceae bacterium]